MTIDFTNPLVEMKTTSVVCSSVAIFMTLSRLYLRRKRLWWDDAWAFFSMLFLFVQIASVFMHVPNPAVLSKTSRVAAYYIIASSFYAIIWSARLSILLSILRIEPFPHHRKRLLIVGAIFGVAAVVLISQLFWVCEPQPNWKNLPSPQCKLNMQVAICQVVTDVLSDLYLCVMPLRIISELRDGRLRRRLTVIFSTSIMTTIVSLVHVGYLLTTGGTNLIIAAVVEDTVSLMVANLPVIFTASLRLFNALDSDLHGDPEDGNVAATRNLTSLGFRSRPARATATTHTVLTDTTGTTQSKSTYATTTTHGTIPTIMLDPSAFESDADAEFEMDHGKVGSFGDHAIALSKVKGTSSIDTNTSEGTPK